MLGDEVLSVRLGGIYALERLSLRSSLSSTTSR